MSPFHAHFRPGQINSERLFSPKVTLITELWEAEIGTHRTLRECSADHVGGAN
jgi:hypothetical protein